MSRPEMIAEKHDRLQPCARQGRVGILSKGLVESRPCRESRRLHRSFASLRMTEDVQAPSGAGARSATPIRSKGGAKNRNPARAAETSPTPPCGPEAFRWCLPSHSEFGSHRT